MDEAWQKVKCPTNKQKRREECWMCLMPHWPLSCGPRSLWGPRTRQRPCLLWAASARATGARAWRNRLRADCCDSSSWKRFLDTVGTSEHEWHDLTLDLDTEKQLTSFLQARGISGESSHCVNAKLKNEAKNSQSMRVKSGRALTMASQQRALVPQKAEKPPGFYAFFTSFPQLKSPTVKAACCVSCWKKCFGAVKSLWLRNETVEGV